jgi:hypothetical protein
MTIIALVMGAAALAPQDIVADSSASPPPLASSARAPVVNPVPVPSPPGRTVDIVSGGDISLDVSEKKSELTLGYSWVGRSQQIVGAGGRELRLARSTLNLELSLPVGGTDNLLSRDTFDGLADGPSLSFSWTWFGTRSADRLGNARFSRITEAARARCLQGLGPPDAERLSAERCNFRADHRTVDFAQDYSGLSEGVINRAILSPGHAVGIEASVGFNVFDYRTPQTLVEHSDTRPQFSVKIYGSFFPADAISAWTLSAEYQNGFEAQDDQILCPAVVANPNDDCVRAPPGPPRNTESLQFALEHRRVLGSIPSLGEIAIAPQGTYDAISNEFELSLPVYLRLERDLGLLPGVSVTYNSEKDHVVIGLFLKRSFGF